MKTVTFRQLRVFTEVARNLSFVRAAEALHLTPPAVTMQIKELESAIELPLFDRQGRKVTLTTAGEYFLVYAKRLLATLKDADDAMARFRKLETGTLSVGLVSTAKYFVPRLLAKFRIEHPGAGRAAAGRRQPRGAGEAAGRWRGRSGDHGPAATRDGLPRRGLRRAPTCLRRPTRPPDPALGPAVGRAAVELPAHRARTSLGHPGADGPLFHAAPRRAAAS